MSEDHYLQLSSPILFDPVTQHMNVFYDDANRQIFAVRSAGATGVTVRGFDETKTTTFQIQDKGPVTSIKFSPDFHILGVQRTDFHVDFINFENLKPIEGDREYPQNCKWKNSKIVAFYWTKVNELLFVTQAGLELFQLIPEKKSCKSIKTVLFSIHWFSWCEQGKIILVSGANKAIVQSYSLKNSTIVKMTRHDFELRRPTSERDVNALFVYGMPWCALLRQDRDRLEPAEIYIFLLSSGVNAYTHVLHTGLMGNIAINVVDHLIAVHHQASQTTQIFDIMETLEGPNVELRDHRPIVAGKSIRPTVARDRQCRMYSASWVVFPPNIVIEPTLGCLWNIEFEPLGLYHSHTSGKLHKVVDILLRRSSGRDTVFLILNDMIKDAKKYLAELPTVFRQINEVYRKSAEQEMIRQTGQSATWSNAERSLQDENYYSVVIHQQDMYTHVLQAHTDNQHILQVLTAYVASLSEQRITIQHSIAELLATSLVRRGQYSRLRQMTRHGCLGDSRPLACLLLSLGNVYPAAQQLALDMLWRLKAYEETIEVLLGCGNPVAALGVAQQAGNKTFSILPARKLLAAALQSQDEQQCTRHFLSVYHALQARNRLSRGAPAFLKGEKCEIYAQQYKELFED